MDEIINAFGIDHRLIIIQIVNFAILMAALGYFLYKPVLKMLQDREDAIAQGLKDAELAAEAKAAANLDKQAVLKAAHAEATAISDRAKQSASTTGADIVAAAEDKAAQVIKDAEAKGEFLKAEALRASEREVAELAVLAAEKILRQKA